MSESEEKSVEEILSKAKVLVATPCFAGLCSAEYMTSMSRLAALASTYKIDISLVTGRNESLITRARNNLASEFLSIPEATHLMFIDSDIGFDPNDVIKLILRDKDVVAGPYPQKKLNWAGIKEVASNGGSEEEMKIASLIFTHALKDEDGVLKNRLNLTGEVTEVDYAGTGFMLIKREVLEQMRDAMTDDEWYSIPGIEAKMYDFFKLHIDKKNRLYLGEDWTFCQTWKDMGGKVWLDESIVLKHVGSYTFGI